MILYYSYRDFFTKGLKKAILKIRGYHMKTNINYTFKIEYSFHGKSLDEIKTKLGRIPKPDFIITKEDERNALWLIGEVKYFREWHRL